MAITASCIRGNEMGQATNVVVMYKVCYKGREIGRYCI